MRASAGLLPLMGAVSAVASEALVKPNNNGCGNLDAHFADDIFYPGSDVYTYESQNFWSNTEIMTPTCVFRPKCAGQLAQAVGYLAEGQDKFAVRGGGHMAIRVGALSDQAGLLAKLTATGIQQHQRRGLDCHVQPDHSGALGGSVHCVYRARVRVSGCLF